MRRFAGLAMSLALLLAAGAKAQNRDIYVDVAVNAPEKTKFRIGVAATGQFEWNGNGYFLGQASTKVLLGKFLGLYGSVGMLPVSVLNLDERMSARNISQPFVAEGRISFHLSDVIRNSQEKKTWKTNDGIFVYTNTITFNRKERSIVALHGTFHTSVRPVGQTKDSLFHLTYAATGTAAPYDSKVVTNQTLVMVGMGINFLQITRFKGKAEEYRVLRSKKFIDTYLEVLYAPIARIDQEVTVLDKETGSEQHYQISNAGNISRFGFRIATEISKGRPGFFHRLELGRRPGYEVLGGSKKWLTNTYLQYGLGLAF